jgi:ribose transport system substrate-binding protein
MGWLEHMTGDRRRSELDRRTLLRWGGALGSAAVASSVLGPLRAAGAEAIGSDSSSGGGGMPVTRLSQLQPFHPSSVVGTKPKLAPRIAWANSSNAEFFIELGDSIEAAAHDRGLQYITAIADNDSATNISQIDSFLQTGIGALCIQPIDAAAQAIVMRQAINEGIDVMSLVTPPSTVQAVANQYAVGYDQGVAAVAWIRQHLGGKAKVVIFNLKTITVLIARDQGVRDGLKTGGPGIEVVEDIETPEETEQSAEQSMATILQAHPDVDVILGTAGDTYSMGALAALRSAGVDTSNMYLSGINGDADALAEIEKGGPYKASFAFAYNLMGYAWGQFAADWLAGKRIPQVMVFNAVELSSKASIDAFNAAMALTGSGVKSSYLQTSKYMKLLGSISYETRDRFITTSPYK